MFSSSSITASESSPESPPAAARSRRRRGLSSSSMPFAYPRQNYAISFEAEALRRAAREEREAEESRNAWEMSRAEKILFYSANGMSEATLASKFGREIVARVLESALKAESPLAAQPAG